MNHHIAEVLASILIVGIALQWIGWRLRIPALILLIAAGFIMGPVTGWLNPSEDFGDLLQPMIALSVAVILFEGGLSLRWHELKQNRQVIYRLISWNVLLTFSLGSFFTHYLVGLSWPVSLVFGAIIIVTGPTVIMPLVKQANLKKGPSSLLRWEGIVNDPVGALLVVLIYGYYVRAESETLALGIFTGLAISLVVSLVLSVGLGVFIAHSFRKGWVPEYLKSPLILIAILLVYTLANKVQSEAGLLATTILGITLANQNLNTLHELKRFKEYVTILLVSSTFIVLTADIDPGIIKHLQWQSWLLIVLVIFVFRPIAIYVSTIGTDISKQERALLAWIAPRGIVAASVAGLFGSELSQLGYEGAELLLPLVFVLIIMTVILHGLSIGWFARKLKLASIHPDGIMIVGAADWSTGLAVELQKNDIPVMLIDTRWAKLESARMQNILTHYGEVLSERTEEVLELAHFTKLVAVTPNEAYNTLACSLFAPELGQRNVYELGWPHVENLSAESVNRPSESIGGERLFGEDVNDDFFKKTYSEGWRFKSTPLTDEYTLEDHLKSHADSIKLICSISKAGFVNFYPWDEDVVPEDIGVLVSYVPPQVDTKKLKKSDK